MNLDEDAAGHKAEQLIVEKLKQAVDRALAASMLPGVSNKLSYVAGFVSNDYPEVADQLMRIWRSDPPIIFQD